MTDAQKNQLFLNFEKCLDFESCLETLSDVFELDKEKIYKKMEDFIEEYKQSRTFGVEFMSFADEDFPKNLKDLSDPPFLLSFLGDRRAFRLPTFSVVGSREPAESTLRWMELELREFIQQECVCIVSGGARGVDSKAHQLSLRLQKPTLIFLPSGLANMYPEAWSIEREHVIQRGGVLVSEFPFGMQIRPHHFYHRNRLIAGVSKYLFVAEARFKSGSMMTAARAAEVGRELLCLPSGVWDTRFSGNLELLRSGAQMITSAQDLKLFWNAQDKFMLE